MTGTGGACENTRYGRDAAAMTWRLRPRTIQIDYRRERRDSDLSQETKHESYLDRRQMARAVANMNASGWRVQFVTALPESRYKVIFVRGTREIARRHVA